MKKQALGKGLKAFLAEDYGIFKEEKFAEVDIERIKPNPTQPRKNFDPATLAELANSINESGVLQPIIVVPEDDHYKIIVGERRWRAAQKAGLQKLPVIIRHLDENKQIEASLIENIQREDLNPLEIAQAYQMMVDQLQYTQSEVADRVGKDRTSVTNYIRLLKLPEEVKAFLANGGLSMGHARAIIPLENREIQTYIARQIVENNLSVRETERTIQKLKKAPLKKPHPEDRAEKDPDLMALQEEFMRILGTKALISGSRDKGIIKIHYFSLEELNRIFELIKGDER